VKLSLGNLITCALSLLLAGCGNTGVYFWIEPTLTQEQRSEVYTVVARWNQRVGNNGVRGAVVNDEAEANRTIGTRSVEWLSVVRGQGTDGVYGTSPGLLVVREDAQAGSFRRILDHEMGHALGIGDHLPEDVSGLMNPHASGPWGEADQAHCRAQGVCE
jgi:hypothetical protein